MTTSHTVVPRRTTIALFLVTVAYLLLEAAFNARLIDVLGATQGDLGSPEAVTGLEFWGRVISSIAVGLALATLHISQRYRERAPFPVNLVDRRAAPWKGGRTATSVAIVASAMVTTFLVERSIVENGAAQQNPVSLWWAHYGARASDFGGLALSYAARDPERAKAAEKALADHYAKESISARPLKLSDLDAADARTVIAILPYTLQNWARRQQRSNEDSRPYSAMEIQTYVNDGFLKIIADMTATQSRTAILVPARRCFEMLYDQSPPYETQAPSYPLPVSNCLSRNATVSSFSTDLPAYLSGAVRDCFPARASPGERYADYVSLNCMLAAARDHAATEAPKFAAIYLARYAEARDQALRSARDDPGLLPEVTKRQLANGLRNMIDEATRSISGDQRDTLFDPTRETPPPCGALTSRLLDGFDGFFDRAAAENWLSSHDADYCALFDQFAPDQPDPTGSQLIYALVPDFADRLSAELRTAGGAQLAFGGGLPTAADFQRDVERQLLAPVRDRLDRVLQGQFSQVGTKADADRLPHVGQYGSLDEFFGNAVVSSLARGTLQDLSDSTFQCVGIPTVARSVRFEGSLRSISQGWDGQFHQKVARALKDNGIESRFSGLLSDFNADGRCHAAGISAYHRATIPGVALAISMAGLLFHGCKLLLYLSILLGFPFAARLGVVTGGLALMLGAPTIRRSELLEQPAINMLIDSFEASHGHYFDAGVRWLIRAELLLYPISDALAQHAFQPLGLTFRSKGTEAVANARSEEIAKACFKVPQIAESSEYESLKTFLTNRTFCNAE